ncbi:MAG: hypothetical protein ACM3Q4_07305 [Acidobacteriota bacterium]
MTLHTMQKVGLWTALAGAVAALVVLSNSAKRKTAFYHRYDDIFGI